MTITLEVINGVYDGLLDSFDSFPITIGRESDNDFVITFEHIASRRHAQIAKEGNGLYILDLKSTNGTFVNDQIVDKAVLVTGDIIKIGGTKIRASIHNV